MQELIEMTRIYMPMLVIPYRLMLLFIVMVFVMGIGIHCGRLKKKTTRHPMLAMVFIFSIMICIVISNVLALLIPIVTWVALTVGTYLYEKKIGLEVDKSINRCIPWFRKKTVARIIADVLALAFIFGFFVPYVGAGIVYQSFFGIRYETVDMYKCRVSDFEGLNCDEVELTSDKGERLAGYFYYKDLGEAQRGVVVMGHGFGGGGHNSYMPCANYFASHGYYVFAYDATGNDNSSGYGILGLPQQILDMDCAITYIENYHKTKGLPIVLWGHSWGGFTATNELSYHPEVKAVISVAGFDYSMDLIKAWGPDYVGTPLTYYVLPYIKLQQDYMCGEVSNSTAEAGFAVSDARVMSVSADNDPVVPVEYGLEYWKKKHSDDQRFEFVSIKGLDESLAHSFVYCSKEYIDWRDSFNEIDFKEWLENLDYDYEAKENTDRFVADKAKFLDQPEVRQARANQIDLKLFDEMLAFYDEAIK